MEFPLDFMERMEQQLGDAYGDFLACYGKERVYGLRYNPLKIEKERLQALLLRHQIALEAVEWAAEGFYYPADAQPGKLPLHEAGAYYIQEPSAMVAVELLDPKPGERILDLCAAPGGKSTQIAGRMRGAGLLVSNETVPSRAKILSRNMERLGVVNAVVLNETPGRLAGRFAAFFDRVLVDAPCSGEGMFRKDPDACGEWSLKQTDACAARQRDILSQAEGMLKPGGILVYSTCTFAPRENEEMAEWFVREYPQFAVEHSGQIWPHLQRGEGHYAVRFRKDGAGMPERIGMPKESPEISERIMGMLPESKGMQGRDTVSAGKTDSRMAGKRKRTHAGKPASANMGKGNGMQQPGKELADFCKEALTEEAAGRILGQAQKGRLAAFGDQLYLLPEVLISLDGLKTERAGLHLGCCKKNRFEPSHALAMALHPWEARQTAELEEPGQYFRGEAVSCSGQKGWTLVTVEGCSAGWGKASQGILKNHYPKGLRKILGGDA